MTEQQPSLEAWRRLYDAAVRVRDLAPWGWMEETDIFGVQGPDSDEPDFVSVMGMAGEHYAIAVYPGAKALYDFWAFEEIARTPYARIEQLLETPQLQASFEDRDILYAEDRALIKRLGLKFRGRNAWPIFRSYRPCYLPWLVNAAEARRLTHVLEQTLDVAPRFREDPTLLERKGEGYPVRVAGREGESLTWQDQTITVSPPQKPPLALQMDMGALNHLKSLPQRGAKIEIDLFMAPATIQEKKGDRPYAPYMLMIVEARSGFIISSELFQPEPAIEILWGKVPMVVAQQLAGVGIRPKFFHVRSDLLVHLLGPLAEELGTRIRQKTILRGLDSAREALNRFMYR